MDERSIEILTKLLHKYGHLFTLHEAEALAYYLVEHGVISGESWPEYRG